MTDPVLHAHFDGANGSTSFSDVSGRHTLTAGNGGAGSATLGTARKKFGPSGLELTQGGSTGPYVNITGNLADFDFGAGDFTVEGWGIWDGAQSGFSTATIGSYRKAGGTGATADLCWSVGVNGSGSLVGRVYSGASQWRADTTGTVPTGTVFAWCLMRSGTNIYVFLDGAVGSVSQAPGAASLNAFASAGQLRLGVGGSIYNDGWKGMLDEVRITPAALYSTAGYTPDTSAFPSICNATGFFSTNFGLPTTAYIATGFLSTHFGTPGTKRVERATGWLAANFGTPLSRQRCTVASMGRTVHFGTPSTPTYRECAVTGFNPVVFGDAVSFGYNPLDGARTCLAQGFRPTRFGRPTYTQQRLFDVAGWLATRFGEPAARDTRTCPVTGFAPVHFGTPASVVITHAHGFHPTHFGSAGSSRTYTVMSIAPRTRFGTPTYTRSGGHHVYGWMATRFGTPRGKTGRFCQATGFLSGGFGTPTGTQRHRASSLVPHTRFGTPLSIRNPRC